jgi:hypothetical protein
MDLLEVYYLFHLFLDYVMPLLQNHLVVLVLKEHIHYLLYLHLSKLLY